MLAAACSEDDQARPQGAVTDSGILTISSSAPATEPTTSASAGTSGVSGGTHNGSDTGGAGSTSTGDEGTAGAVSSGLLPDCVCVPGEIGGCDDDAQSKCTADCLGYEPVPCPPKQTCSGGACVAFCTPNERVCAGEAAYKECDGDGGAFGPPVPCQDAEGCVGGSCLNLCAQAEAEPSTIGCSFIALRADNVIDDASDAVVVGNVSKTKTAMVQLYFTPTWSIAEKAQGGPVALAPGKTRVFQMTNLPFNRESGLRVGGTYRVQSSIPVVAYQHSPIFAQATNDASLLFPEHALKKDYVIASWEDTLGYPGYFNVIAVQDGTTVQWTPSQDTTAGLGVWPVKAGQTGQVTMNRFDTLQVRVESYGDLTGTFVHADKPIWVLGAAECVNVPNEKVGYCDHIQEQMLPLDYWGKTYVGARSPKRGTEKHYWRILGGADGTTVTTDPPQPGTPIVVNKAQWKELIVANDTSFILTGNKPFLAVQYLEGQVAGAGTGDPAMYQMVPVEQFLDRYAFVTGTGYDVHYVQIIRVQGGADVLVDGVVVDGYSTVGDYQVADWKISEGAHLAESTMAFGIVGVGYTTATSYAYPGGLKLAVLNPQ